MDNFHISTPNIVDSHVSETQTPMESQPSSLPFPIANGLLRRAQPLRGQPSSPPKSAHDSIYQECVKNHAANIGGLAYDGCGGYIACPSSPLSLKCDVCGCHRNFHRSQHNYQLYYAPPPPPIGVNSASPPPPFLPSFYPPPPYIVQTENNLSSFTKGQSEFQAAGGSGIRKRSRTKFSCEQKVRMQDLAERLGWKMRKNDEDTIEMFCREIGVERSVLKIWMHNHKNAHGKRDVPGNGVDSGNEDTVGLPFEGNNDMTGPDDENVANVSSSSFF